VRVPLQRPHFGVDWQRVRDAMTSRTRLLIVNSPHNPTGAVFSDADLDALGEVLRDSPALVLADEVYEHIVFGGRQHASLLRRPELAERSFVVSSFGKTFHCTGWKIGYCVAPPALTAEFRKVHQLVQFAVASPMQAGLAEFLGEYPGHAGGLAAFYERKRDHFCRLLERTPLTFVPAAGTYFQLADYSGVSDLPDVEFARWLTREVRVAAIPVSVFSASPSGERLVRFCFAKSEATLDAAGERLSGLPAIGGTR
jgi:methionine aminotransferase